MALCQVVEQMFGRTNARNRTDVLETSVLGTNVLRTNVWGFMGSSLNTGSQKQATEPANIM